jgi:hypothetical protein
VHLADDLPPGRRVVEEALANRTWTEGGRHRG